MGRDASALSSPSLRLRPIHFNCVLLTPNNTAESKMLRRDVQCNKKPKLFRSSLHFPKPQYYLTITVLLLIGLLPPVASQWICPTFCQCSNPSAYTSMQWQSPPHLPSVNCSNQNLDDFTEAFHSLHTPSLTDNNSVSTLGPQDPHVHVLDLSYNKFHQIQLTDDNHSWLIDSLDLSHNFISGFELDVNCSLRVLLSLDLSFNHLESLGSHGWTQCPGLLSLLEINLSHNAIGELANTSFSSLVMLQTLDLSFNRLQTVSGTAFDGLTSLKYLFLDGNDLQRIADVFPSLPNLVLIDLSNNSVENFPRNTFSSLASLKHLDLGENNITYLETNVFNGLTNLVELSLNQNPMTSLEAGIFQSVPALQKLSLSHMRRLDRLGHLAFSGLGHLVHLNLSHNHHLTFLQPNILSALTSLHVLDLSHSGFQQLSSTTFHNPNLRQVYLSELPLSCNCTNAWLVDESLKSKSIFIGIATNYCYNGNNQTAADFECGEVSIGNTTSNADVRLGSQLMLQCQQESISKAVLKWTTPSGQEFYHHDFHQESLVHLLAPEDVQPDAVFHKGHYWHQSSSYHDEISSNDDRIVILSDGSLFIDYMLRQDAGDYTCEVKNAHYNQSITVTIHLDYEISGRIKIFAYVVGFLSALGLFALNVVCVVISWTARHLVNKRRREIIHQMLESLNAYKSTHVTRIHENYLHQLSRVRNQYHLQRDRLHKNYTSQVARVKRGCSNQVERVRDNYNSKLNQLREYSSRQIVQIRESANNQIARIRDYGSLQLERLRETYKLQQQHVLKLLDTMNLDNCRSVVETECMRTESMMFDIDLLETDDRVESPTSPESDYNTATSSPNMSDGLTADMEDHEYDGEELYRELQQENDQMARDNDMDHNEIQMEMNTQMHFPNGVNLEAKEMWTAHGDEDNVEDHTLYIKMHGPDLEMQAQTRPRPKKSIKQCSPSSYMVDTTRPSSSYMVDTTRPSSSYMVDTTRPSSSYMVDTTRPSSFYMVDTRRPYDNEAELAPLPLHTVSCHSQGLLAQSIPELPGSPSKNSLEETWSGNYVTPEASPIKLRPQSESSDESYEANRNVITLKEDEKKEEDNESRL